MPDIQPKNIFDDALALAKANHPETIRGLPSWPPYDIMLLHGHVIQQEFSNLVAHMGKPDFVSIVATCMTLTSQLLGMLISMGVDIEPIWTAMNKAALNGTDKPDIAAIIASQTKNLNG